MDEQLFVNTMELSAALYQKLHPRCSENDIIVNLSLPERFSGLNVPNYLEVKKSSIHGNGVFAKVDIGKDKVVCIYPVHGIVETEKNIFHRLYSRFHQVKPTHFNIDDYKFNISKDWGRKHIYGDPKIHDYFSLGHMINDSCRNANKLKKTNIGKDILQYLLQTFHNSNCYFKISKYYIYVLTTKKISKGEELLTSYGFSYWFEYKPQKLISLYLKYLESLPTKMQKSGIELLRDSNGQKRLALKPSLKMETAVSRILETKTATH